jgi:hypothetical protein
MMQVTKVWWDGEKLMAEPIDPTTIYQEPSPVQQPFCFYYVENGEEYFAPKNAYVPDNAQPLYTTPPAAQRQWVGLAEADKDKPDLGAYVYLNDDWLDGYKTGMEYAEAKLKEKNNG